MTQFPVSDRLTPPVVRRVARALGRIETGAKAGLLFWEGVSLFMTPLRDPVRNIVYSAQVKKLNAAMVDGRFITQDRVVTGIDTRALAADLQRCAECMWNIYGTPRLGRTRDRPTSAREVPRVSSMIYHQ